MFQVSSSGHRESPILCLGGFDHIDPTEIQCSIHTVRSGWSVTMPLFLGVARAWLGLQTYAYYLSVMIDIVALSWLACLRPAVVSDLAAFR